MLTRTRNRWPKGTWMELQSTEMLRLLIKQRGCSYRELADAVGVSHGFISHLAAGRRKSCPPDGAERIAFWLGVPVTVAFKPSVTIATSRPDNGKRAA